MKQPEKILDPNKVIAIGKRLKDCNNVITLGVKTDFSKYHENERRRIIGGEKIYYPTTFYADILDTAGIPIFPSYHTYKYAQDKIKQTALFQILRILHPRTKIYYALKRQKITEEFQYPFIAKIPRGSAMGKGVYLIKNSEQLQEYLLSTKIAYIQEYLPIQRDIRIVVIGDKSAVAYFRTAQDDNFKTNISAGGIISFDGVPKEAIKFGEYVAKKCGLNDVGVDICE